MWAHYYIPFFFNRRGRGITPPGVEGHLLLEDGNFILLETDGLIDLERFTPDLEEE